MSCSVLPPVQLPQAVRAYYQGPAARGYVPVDLEVHAADEARSPSPARYAHVESRIGSSSQSQQRPEALHSELRTGARLPTDGASERARVRSARRLTPLSQSLPDAAEMLRSTTNSPLHGSGGMQAAPTIAIGPRNQGTDTTMGGGKRGDPVDLVLKDKRAVVATIPDPAAEEGSGPKVAKPRLRRGATTAAAATEGGTTAGPSGSVIPPMATALISAPNKFAASMKTLIGKVLASKYGTSAASSARSKASGGPPAGSSRKKLQRASAAAPQQQQELPLCTKVMLPSTPTEMLVSTSGRGGGVIERVLLSQGYMRSNLLKILDQLPHFQRQVPVKEPPTQLPRIHSSLVPPASHLIQRPLHSPPPEADLMYPPLPFLCRLDEVLKELVAARFRTFEYPAGSRLFHPDTVCNEAHILLSGRCTVLSYVRYVPPPLPGVPCCVCASLMSSLLVRRHLPLGKCGTSGQMRNQWTTWHLPSSLPPPSCLHTNIHMQARRCSSLPPRAYTCRPSDASASPRLRRGRPAAPPAARHSHRHGPDAQPAAVTRRRLR